MLNNGRVQVGGGDVVAYFYYDVNSLPAGDSQPLINGPRGYAMEVINKTGEKRFVSVSGGNQPFNVGINPGDPVTTGVGRSRTVTELAAMNIRTRGDIGEVQLL